MILYNLRFELFLMFIAISISFSKRNIFIIFIKSFFELPLQNISGIELIIMQRSISEDLKTSG